jgi:hypothetical protein
MEYAVEMGSDAMIYMPNFIMIDFGHSKIDRGDTQTAWRSHKPALFFKIMIVG